MLTDADVGDILRSLSRPAEPIPVQPPAAQIPRRGLPRNLKIRAVFFDIYGTLFISGSGDIGAAPGAVAASDQLTEFLRRFGITKTPKAVHTELESAIRGSHKEGRLQGVSWPEVEIRRVWADLLPKLRSPGNPAPTAKEVAVFAASYEALTNPVWPMPGLADLLDRAAGSGRVLGIVSNAQFYTPALFPAFTGRSLGAWGFSPELLIYSYEMGYAKPDPRLYEELARRLASGAWLPVLGGANEARGSFGPTAEPNTGPESTPRPEECIYVGNDLLKDCWAADQAGFRTVLYAGDRRSLRLHENDSKLQGFRPDEVVASLDELADILRRH